MKYKILRADSINELEANVIVYLPNGWKLEGGVSSIKLPEGNGSHLIQAMTKK